jgi:hypothetical protein
VNDLDPQPSLQYIDCSYLENEISAGIPSRLSWDNDGLVRLVTTSMSDIGDSGTEILVVHADKIQHSLVADGATGLYLTVNSKMIHLVMTSELTDGLQANAYIADTIIQAVSAKINEDNKLEAFQSYLKSYGVQTEKSNLLRLILITVICFIVILGILATILLTMF